jgi:hypothetical protein
MKGLVGRRNQVLDELLDAVSVDMHARPIDRYFFDEWVVDEGGQISHAEGTCYKHLRAQFRVLDQRLTAHRGAFTRRTHDVVRNPPNLGFDVRSWSQQLRRIELA